MNEYTFLLVFLLAVLGFVSLIGCMAMHIIIAAEDKKKRQHRNDTKKKR